MKLLYFILLLFIPVIGIAQENIQVQVYQNDIRVEWDDGPEGPMMNYLVCYAQSEDTAAFRFHNFMEGAPYADMYEWFCYYGPYPFATIWNKSFIFAEDSTSGFIKLGVLGQRFDSTWTNAYTFGPFPASTIGEPKNIMVQK